MLMLSQPILSQTQNLMIATLAREPLNLGKSLRVQSLPKGNPIRKFPVDGLALPITGRAGPKNVSWNGWRITKGLPRIGGFWVH